MSRSEDIKSLYGEVMSMAAGATMLLAPQAGQLAISIKLLAGGTLFCGGISSTNYPLSANEIVAIGASGRMWLAAAGATCTFAMLRGLTVPETP